MRRLILLVPILLMGCSGPFMGGWAPFGSWNPIDWFRPEPMDLSPVADVALEDIVLPSWLSVSDDISEEDLRFLYLATLPQGAQGGGVIEERPSPVSGLFVRHTVAEPGLTDRAGAWLMTDAVIREQQGWVTDMETGKSTRMLLIPRFQGERDIMSVEGMSRIGVVTPRYIILAMHRDTRDQG